MAKPNWGRGIGVGLSTLGAYLQRDQERRAAEQAAADEIARQNAEYDRRQADYRAWVDSQEAAKRQAELLANPVVIPSTGLGAVPGSAGQPLVPNPFGVEVRKDDLPGGALMRLVAGLPLVDTKPVEPTYDYPGIPGPVDMGEYIALRGQDMRGSGRGGSSQPSDAELRRLETDYFGSLTNTGAGRPGTARGASRALTQTLGDAGYPYGSGPIDAARSDWRHAVDLGLIGPNNIAQADSIMGEYLPAANLSAELDLDGFNRATGQFYDKTWHGTKDINVDTAREKIADLLAKSSDRVLTYEMIKKALSSGLYSMTTEEIARVLPKIADEKMNVRTPPRPESNEPPAQERKQVRGVWYVKGADGKWYSEE